MNTTSHTLSEGRLGDYKTSRTATTGRQSFNRQPEMNPTSIHDSPTQYTKALPPTTQIPEHEESEASGNSSAAMRWLIASLSFVILSPVVSVILGLNLHGRDFQYLDKSTYGGRTVTLPLTNLADHSVIC